MCCPGEIHTTRMARCHHSSGHGHPQRCARLPAGRRDCRRYARLRQRHPGHRAVVTLSTTASSLSRSYRSPASASAFWSVVIFFGRRSAFRARGIHGVGAFSHGRYVFRPLAVPTGRSTDEDDTYRDYKKFRTWAKIVGMLKAIGNSPKLRGLLSIAGTSPGFSSEA